MARAPSSGVPGQAMKIPRSFVRAAVTLGVVGSTLGATLFVASVAPPALVNIPALSGPSYARDLSAFHPVSRQLTKDVASSPVGTPTPAPIVSRSPSSKPIESHVPESTPTPSAPGEHAPPPSPSLTVTVAADTRSTHKNHAITYTITITNAGPGVANDLVVESHVPDGTSLLAWMCNGTSVSANGASSFTCGALGSAPKPNHPLVFAVSALASGASITEQFTVDVNHDVAHNSAIVEHAHAYAANADLADSPTTAVIVR
ncbi:MAG: hypothetical protein ACXVP8_03130 [Actinomycetota bacterium]